MSKSKLLTCPICRDLKTTRYPSSRIYKCTQDHYWKLTEEKEIINVRRLSVSEASIILAFLTQQYKDEFCQFHKMGVFLEVSLRSLDCLDDLREAQIEMVINGELIVFMLPDNNVNYVLLFDSQKNTRAAEKENRI